MARRAPLVVVSLALLLLVPQLAASADDISRARRDMDGVTKRLNDLDAWFSTANRKQRSLQKDLRTTDQSIAATNKAIREIEAQLNEIRDALTALKGELTALELQRDEQAQRIAQHLAAAYRLSGEDFIKLLLNQEDPDRFDRMLRYHRYFSAARSEALDAYRRTMLDIESNATETSAREAALAERQAKLDGQRQELLTQRRQRTQLLAALSDEMKGKSKERSQLAEDRARLETLITELNRRAQSIDGTAFARSKGKLPWPAKGTLAHRFGSQRAGGLLKWQGIFITAKEGAPVTAIASGRVAFSDWLRGFGLLTIIDHGSGYMSLYAHSDVLYKRVGETVRGGEAVATTGKSGGQNESGLYFEIRYKGTATDPLVWLTRR
jgi:septal ring factor EnvC (AmiA/AmiB activator)